MAQQSQASAEYDWQPQPQAAACVQKLIDGFLHELPALRRLAQRMRDETGTRLTDWVDHLQIRPEHPAATELATLGFVEDSDGDHKESLNVWRHPGALFPPIVVTERESETIGIKVESVVDFARAHGLQHPLKLEGDPGGPWRRLIVEKQNDTMLCCMERHGDRGFSERPVPDEWIAAAVDFRENFELRQRQFPDDAEGFKRTQQQVADFAADLGTAWTCDLFFAAERKYWQSRNQAARIQKARQDALGLGWANHDHHTYRSSRRHFSRLIALLEQLGFRCRERFYAGREAGWGAQVLEQPDCGIVIFADVDLAPEEVAGDFAHVPLPSRSELGTVGLWCELHGEAVLQAGMHHLECQFDFDAARAQLAEVGVPTMSPFTDLPYLKQAFTRGEIWPIATERLDKLFADGSITTEQADKFRRDGSLGSHLEILERNDGYQGFNQTGINDIIRETDPRGTHAN